MPVELWPFRPELGCTETLEFFSDVMSSRTGEQRLSLRSAPRQSFSYSHRLLDEQQFARAYGFARQNGVLPVSVPVWGEQVAYGPVDAGVSVLAFNTSTGDWRIGAQLVVWEDDQNYVVRTIAGIGSGYISLTAIVGQSFTHAVVCPVRTAFTTDGFNISRDSVRSAFSVNFQVIDNIDLAANYVSPYPQYGELDVMLDAPRLVTDVHEKIMRQADYVDNSFGPIIVETLLNYAQHGQTVVFHDERTDLWRRRLWLHSLRGRQKLFWLPTFNRDFILQEIVDAASTTLSVASIGPARSYVDREIMIERKDGIRYFRSIKDAASVGGGIDNLTLSASLGAVLDPADINMISYLSAVRLDTDSVDIQHNYDLCSVVSIPVLEVRDVSPAAAPVCELFIDFINHYIYANGAEVPWANLDTIFGGRGVTDAGGWYIPSPGTGSGFFDVAAWPVFEHPDGRTIVVEYYQPEPYDLTGYRFVFDTNGSNDLFFDNVHFGVEFAADSDREFEIAFSGSDLIGICRFAVSGDNAIYSGSQNGLTAYTRSQGDLSDPPPLPIFAPGNDNTYSTIYTLANVAPTEMGTRIRSFCVRPYAGPLELPSISAVPSYPHPAASNSGYQISMGTLTPVSSPIVTTADGQIIELFDSTSSIWVQHKNVIVRKGRLHGTSGAYAIKCNSTGTNFNTIIEDVTIAGSYTAGITGTSMTIRRCDISGVQNGIYFADYRNIVSDNYIHNLMAGQPSCCIKMDATNGRHFVQHNTLICDQPSGAAISYSDFTKPPSNMIATLTVHDNHLGGGNYTFILDNHYNSARVENVHVTANVFDPIGVSGYGYISSDALDFDGNPGVSLWLDNHDGSGNLLTKP